MNVNLPLGVFSKILLLMESELGNLPLEEAMESGKLEEYVARYKAGELDLSDVKTEYDDEDC